MKRSVAIQVVNVVGLPGSHKQNFYPGSNFFEPFFRSLVLMNKNTITEPDTRLMQRVVRRDRQAFEKLYELSYPRLRFFLLRMLRDPSMVDDVLVETYAAVWKSAGNYSGRAKVTTWIFGIARNLAYKELGKLRYHDDIDNFPNLSDHISPEAESSNRTQLVRMAMDQISDKHREVLDLAFFHDLSYPEISNLLDIPVNTVKTRIFHAKKAFEESLRKMRIYKNDL